MIPGEFSHYVEEKDEKVRKECQRESVVVVIILTMVTAK